MLNLGCFFSFLFMCSGVPDLLLDHNPDLRQGSTIQRKSKPPNKSKRWGWSWSYRSACRVQGLQELAPWDAVRASCNWSYLGTPCRAIKLVHWFQGVWSDRILYWCWHCPCSSRGSRSSSTTPTGWAVRSTTATQRVPLLRSQRSTKVSELARSGCYSTR